MSDPAFPFPIDPKELIPTAIGFVIGIGILLFFIALGLALDMTFLVNVGNIPHQ